MPLSPPESPTVGQTYAANGRTWSWTGSAWELVASAGAADSRWDLFLPSAPTGLTVTAGNAQASLSWTAPTGVIAQAPITDYREQYSTNNGTTWTTFTAAASTATSATVTGLTNGTAYLFRVAAVNGVGTGAYTAASSSVTPAAGTPPNAPTSLTATAGNAQIALSWTAPSAPGTSAISGYTVEYTPSGGSAQTVSTGSTSTSYTLTGLTNGTAYTVRVAGVSAAGTGTFTAASSSVTPSAMATVTGGTVITPGDGYAYRTFTSSGTLDISGSSLTADVLVVGGGGGGGKAGGGGGGVLYQTSQTLNSGSYAVTVAGSVNPSANGGSSSLGASYTATGGAGGVNNWVTGGTSGFPTSTSNTTGNAGGAGDTARGDCDYVGGGGGGAGGAGSTPPCNVHPAGGGAGRAIWGTTYGAGGDGVDQETGTNAPANLGRGGSGTTSRGGSGVVVIRYLAT